MPAVMLTNRMVKVMLMRWSSGRKKLLHDEHPHGPNKIGRLEKHHLEITDSGERVEHSKLAWCVEPAG